MKCHLALLLVLLATSCKSEAPKRIQFTRDQGPGDAVGETPQSGNSEKETPGNNAPGNSSGGTTTGTDSTEKPADGDKQPEKENETPEKNPETNPDPNTNPPPPSPTAPKFDLLDRRLDQATFLTAHNAFVNRKDSSFIAVNQSMSIKDQLENGVEGLMLDIYNNDGKVIMCHGKCTGIPGIFPTQDFGKALDTIADFVSSHPQLILTVFLEDYAGNAEVKGELDRHPKFRDLIFNPYAADVINKGWPKIRDLINMKKRILVISDRDDKKNLGIGFARDLTVENYWSLGNGSDLTCRTRWDEIPLNRSDAKFNRLFVMNHFRDIPLAQNSAKDNRKDYLWDRMEKECLPAAGRRPNFIAVDHFDEGDWGARKLVGDMNTQAGTILFKDTNYAGGSQVLREGKYKTADLKIGDNQLSSLRVFQGYRIKLYKDDNFNGLAGEVVADSPIPAAFPNDEVSSIIVEKIP